MPYDFQVAVTAPTKAVKDRIHLHLFVGLRARDALRDCRSSAQFVG